jgi:hypothetical protein
MPRGHSPTAQMSQHAARSSPGLPQQRRYDGQHYHLPQTDSTPSSSHLTMLPESWVEVSSQPSSSSLSSIGDEIVTTGLHVGGRHGRRRRAPASMRSLPHHQTAIYAAGTSSQEEYDDSESDDDRLATSSTDNMQSSPERVNVRDDSDADSDDGDNATALGKATDRQTFRPQPNAFSHPPSHLVHRSNSSGAAIPSHIHGDFTRPSFSQRSQTRVHHHNGPSAFMSPSAREDNDAALRASLTTLLSCAAAARGLPKSKDEAEARRVGGPGVGPSNQPMDLRLVAESELMEEEPAQSHPALAGQRSSPRRRTPSSGTGISMEKPKRSASTGRSSRTSKKKKTAVMAEEAYISPTLLTWVMSAGVVVLVSVVGFGAGYIIGREVGRQEVLTASVGGANETTSCGREALRTSSGGLRRFKWSAVGKSIAA